MGVWGLLCAAHGGVVLKFPLTPPKQKCETSCEQADCASRHCQPGDLEPENGAVGVEISTSQPVESVSTPVSKFMKIADRVDLVGAHGVVGRVHASLAKRMLAAGKGSPIRSNGITVGVQLPSVPCGERDLAFHGGNSGRQHRVEVCNGGAEVVIETETTLARIAVTQSCRVFALKHSSRVLGEVLSAERAELRA